MLTYTPALPSQQTQGTRAAGGSAARVVMLEPGRVVSLAPGMAFQVAVPLQLDKTINIGTAELRVTLVPDGGHTKADAEVVLIANLQGRTQLLAKGSTRLLLQGVLPAVPKGAGGTYRASEFSIHFGSGSALNVGTPEEQFIDRRVLADELMDMRVTLMASATD